MSSNNHGRGKPPAPYHYTSSSTKTLSQRLLNKKGGITLVALALTLAIIVVGAIIALPHNRNAHAAGATISISPTGRSYNPPSSLIGVTGAGYGALETVKIYWNYTGPGTGTLKGSSTTTAKGGFLFYFVTPLAPTGIYTIGAVGQTSGSVATGTFKLLPSVFVSPDAGGPSTPLRITGAAFGAGEMVKLTWNGPTGPLLGTATGDSTGSFAVSAAVPANVSIGTGGVSIAGVGQTTHASGFYGFTFYGPTIALAPLTGPANTLLTITAYGFKGGEKVNVYWNNGTTPIHTAKTETHGYLLPTTFSIPAGTQPRSYPISVVGQTTHITAANSFTVIAVGSKLSVSSGPVGESVKVTGQGYAPNQTVNILWNYAGPNTGTNVGSVKAGLSGTVAASFNVPVASTGSYTVAVVGTSEVTQNSFTVSNGLAASPSSSAPGTGVTAAGTGFQANEVVNLYWDSTSGTLLTTATATAAGNVSKGLTLPASATPGSHSIIAVGQTSHQSFTAAVTINTNWADFGQGPALHRENTAENTLNVGNVANLQFKWKAPIATNNLGSPSPVYANGIVYMATPDGFLNAYNATTGTMKWQFNPHTGFINLSAPLVDVANGVVFFGTMAHQDPGSPSPFYALDAQTGTLLWSIILPCNEFGEPTLAFNTIYIGTSLAGTTGTIYALDETSGAVNWHLTVGGGVWGAIGVDTSAGTVFASVGVPTIAIVALNATTGAQLWQHPLPTFGRDQDVRSGMVFANGFVYLSSKNGYVYALHESDGSQAWATQIATTSTEDVSTPALGSNGVLYVGSLDNFLYAINATTGAVVWKAPKVGGIDSSPAIANGVVYFSSFNSNIYAVDETSGKVLWSYATGGLSFSSPVVANGWLYCGSDDGNLYAFSL